LKNNNFADHPAMQLDKEQFVHLDMSHQVVLHTKPKERVHLQFGEETRSSDNFTEKDIFSPEQGLAGLIEVETRPVNAASRPVNAASRPVNAASIPDCSKEKARPIYDFVAWPKQRANTSQWDGKAGLDDFGPGKLFHTTTCPVYAALVEKDTGARIPIHLPDIGLAVKPTCSAAQFAVALGMRQPQHMSEVLRGRDRHTSCGWTGRTYEVQSDAERVASEKRAHDMRKQQEDHTRELDEAKRKHAQAMQKNAEEFQLEYIMALHAFSKTREKQRAQNERNLEEEERVHAEIIQEQRARHKRERDKQERATLKTMQAQTMQGQTMQGQTMQE
jgi:hypothetical protein